MAVSLGGEDDEKPMDTETGKTGDEDEKMTEAEKEGGAPRVTATRFRPRPMPPWRREEPTVNQGKMITSEDQAGLGD
jgi:hypothetical protein